MSTLEDNLIVDFEDGSDYVEALKVKVGSLKDLAELYDALEKSSHKYRFITIDTVTALEDFARPLALALYNNTQMGKDYRGDILQAPMGAGYAFLRQAIENIINKLQSFTKNIILVGHVKDKTITSLEGKDVGSVLSFDLTGEIS